MAPTYNAVAVAASAVNPAAQDYELARRTAALLFRIQPTSSEEEVALDLQGELSSERLSREARGLNHWDQHAPRFLSTRVRQARYERALRRRKIEAFRRDGHSEAFAFAYAALKDRDEAENVLAQTYVEFLTGKTDERHFFHALKMNVLDRQRRLFYENEVFEPTTESFESRESSGEDGEGDDVSWEPISTRPEDQDPLDILIAHEEETEHARLVESAKLDPRWRYIKLREWAAPLREDVRN